MRILEVDSPKGLRLTARGGPFRSLPRPAGPAEGHGLGLAAQPQLFFGEVNHQGEKMQKDSSNISGMFFPFRMNSVTVVVPREYY